MSQVTASFYSGFDGPRVRAVGHRFHASAAPVALDAAFDVLEHGSFDLLDAKLQKPD